MAYFECITGSASSGDGVALIVECDSNFAGSVIIADNGEDIFTETCPSVSPYTVRFEGIPIGTYTISGVSQGQTFTTQFTVLDYETTLNATPEGATVLPVNDIQIWLHCAGIYDKTYTTLDEVLADNTILLALISDHNAVDYMVRSTSWASTVCANQIAMGYIGNNDYCADTLLADATWCEAICNSEYFESVLNVKVPTMTSNTTPSGEAFDGANSIEAYKAFDGDDASYIRYGNNIAGIWGYIFPSAVRVMVCYAHVFMATGQSARPSWEFTIQASNDNNTWTNVGSFAYDSRQQSTETNREILSTSGKYLYYRLYAPASQGSKFQLGASTIQFYGRA